MPASPRSAALSRRHSPEAGGARWDIIGHGDAAPWNIVFRNGLLAAPQTAGAGIGHGVTMTCVGGGPTEPPRAADPRQAQTRPGGAPTPPLLYGA